MNFKNSKNNSYFNLNICLLIPIIGVSIIALVLSCLTFLKSPNTSYFMIDFTQAKLDNVYQFYNKNDPTTLLPYDIETNTTLQHQYRFGLWGVCAQNGKIDLNDMTKDIDCSRFVSYGMSPWIPYILKGAVKLASNDEDFNLNLPDSIMSFNPDFAMEQAFNGILGGVICSILELVFLFIGGIVSVIIRSKGYAQKAKIIMLSCLIAISLGHWVSMSIGLSSWKYVSNTLDDILHNSYSKVQIRGIQRENNFRMGWCSMSFGVINFVCLIIMLINICLTKTTTSQRTTPDASESDQESLEEKA
ncbi:putative membrane protein [Wickerhamomyces ciferrii]|uniref:Membrane protein n=1 Tax=Wickerhamomyces ciferrii (strain ATCC 14091 / BCRC 22168 / CBS 111 / JCM 3599 / NBRC 0793 / NRRL Y-1031 F-60-10) TaxID=1206466 RepID=K0KL05_WICCF|nr:uncharacterized protein BN7_2387 [Wickerhamomyces ciferrii]CCH42842.1 putative membrane protein [Wickerhamomyces ciferrii]